MILDFQRIVYITEDTKICGRTERSYGDKKAELDYFFLNLKIYEATKLT